MRFNELELNKLIKKGYDKFTIEDEITFNILNFIHCIHLNKQDFYAEAFESKLFGDIEMEFKKASKCLIGYCKVYIKDRDKVLQYLFTENGYELLDDVLRMKD
ncbi:hypothetical protein CACET_c27270 [Clostridium aceticum]|uniref:Uncharacterized protein n=1 Tax=Clostridium aceticum TaxID=84022 RepID=A0A0D8I8K1_9CLOT|nr:hypothetical protein [Clostridium aceticum]AKL96172.1 hypothetical protein CACET_c27270 [Clostridium aceticum]KJF26593.1 hypothetical protein TZ02_12005 [Clostridium aceticum]